jgi:transcriptional regulator with XRE-family HTH domain
MAFAIWGVLHGLEPRPHWVEGQRHYLSAEVAAELGLSFREAAERTGVSSGHLCWLEQSKRCPSVAVAHALIEGLWLEPDVARRLLDEARPDVGRNFVRLRRPPNWRDAKATARRTGPRRTKER